MASVAAATENRVSITRSIGNGLSTITAHPLVTLGIAFLFGVLPSLLLYFVLPGARAGILGGIGWWTGGRGFDAVLGGFNFVLGLLAQAALIRATAAHAQGRTPAVDDMLAAAFRTLLVLIAIAIVSFAAIVVGMMLLVVPGIILYLVWSVANAVAVEERRGVFDSLSRSRMLTKGARWRILGLWLLPVVGSLLVAGFLGLLVGSSAGFNWSSAAWNPSVGARLFNAALQTLTVAATATIQTALYLELRNWKDGGGQTELAEIFA